MKITIIAGARPNFMKIAPIIRAIHSRNGQEGGISFRLVHTGQHYDHKMSHSFFEQLNIPAPDANLGAGGGTQAEQTAAIMVAFEKDLLNNPADVVLVVGDVTSTMACTIVAKKLNTPVVHVEAGIRSGDLSMPEEINRIVTDSLSDHFFTTSEVANNNLRHHGVSEDRIHFVGNTMIDTLIQNLSKLKAPPFLAEQDIEAGSYLVVTLHRPANVDDDANLKTMLDAILDGSGNLPVVFPVHPRTMARIQNIGYRHHRLIQVEPLGYHEFIYLIKNAMGVVTDSGGITEEATYLGVPCMTLRDSTERPETVTEGSNELVGTDPGALRPYLDRLMEGEWKKGGVPHLWDGHTSERIVEKLAALYAGQVAAQ